MRTVVELEKLRDLRSRAEELLRFAATDLEPFLHPFDKATFLRTPTSLRKKGDVNVTTTCSCVMSLALSNKFEDVYENGLDDAARAFELVVDAPWKSSGLVENNAFTTTLVVRTLGFLLESSIEDERVSGNARCKRWLLDSDKASEKKSIAAIAKVMAFSEAKFSINKYPPTSTIIYWFIDGCHRGRVRLPVEGWKRFCIWAAEEFNDQLALIVSGHEAMMDPVAMAMAACVCARLRMILESAEPPFFTKANYSNELSVLPSRIELEKAIKELLAYQRNGIWPKYFPLFHYDKAGSNFCFTFELLEAVLVEFGIERNELLDDKEFIGALDGAITWCQRNRLSWRGKSGGKYTGWNSGGYLETLKRGQPESWATAVIYMFLWELQKVLSERIQARLLDKYKAREQVAKNVHALDHFLPIEILEVGGAKTLKSILRETVISNCRSESEQSLRIKPIRAARSALLFGPPGTSKTGVVRAVAEELGWPLVQIDPSHFLRQNLEKIYIQAGEIFSDLMDLSGVVVLFDEMDPLVQTRDSENRLDTTAQFLTTFMLPRILDLYKRGRTVFFMATNFQHRFDPAIKRPGRFDHLLCMGPPPLAAKIQALEQFAGGSATLKETKSAAELLRKYIRKAPQLKAQLEFYTFDEFKSLMRSLKADYASLDKSLKARTVDQLAEFVKIDSKSVGLQLRELEALRKLKKRFDTIQQIKKLDINRDELKKEDIKETPIIQYVVDRRQSRIARA